MLKNEDFLAVMNIYKLCPHWLESFKKLCARLKRSCAHKLFNNQFNYSLQLGNIPRNIIKSKYPFHMHIYTDNNYCKLVVKITGFIQWFFVVVNIYNDFLKFKYLPYVSVWIYLCTEQCDFLKNRFAVNKAQVMFIIFHSMLFLES